MQPMTFPRICGNVSGGSTMSSIWSFSGCMTRLGDMEVMRLTEQTSSHNTTAISSNSTDSCFLTTTKSPSAIPIFIMLLPCTRNKNKPSSGKTSGGSAKRPSIFSTASSPVPQLTLPTRGTLTHAVLGFGTTIARFFCASYTI